MPRPELPARALRIMLMRLLAAGTRMPAWVDAGCAEYAGRLRGDGGRDEDGQARKTALTLRPAGRAGLS